jgi:hypothetical protein
LAIGPLARGNPSKSTEAQTNANRQNAQHSTGPRAESGKSNSSRNHLIQGLYTRQDYVKPDERHIYKEFCETMFSQLSPGTLLEESFVSEITGATWRLRRCSAAEAELVRPYPHEGPAQNTALGREGELADYVTEDPMLDEKTDKTRRGIERARASE